MTQGKWTASVGHTKNPGEDAVPVLWIRVDTTDALHHIMETAIPLASLQLALEGVTT